MAAAIVPAGSSQVPFPERLRRQAHFSSCGRFRYALRRLWNPALPQCTFIGLNPSRADAWVDDPTVRRCIGFARHWGFGSLLLLNLFAPRATDPRALRQVDDPVGPRNDRWLRAAARETPAIVAVWGDGGRYRGRADRVRSWLGPLLCLGETRNGQPRHPLYLSADTPLRALTPAGVSLRRRHVHDADGRRGARFSPPRRYDADGA